MGNKQPIDTHNQDNSIDQFLVGDEEVENNYLEVRNSLLINPQELICREFEYFSILLNAICI